MVWIILFHVIMQMSYMPLSVIITTFKKEDVKRPLEGFGVLVPSKEQQNGLKTLGNTLLGSPRWRNLDNFHYVLAIHILSCTHHAWILFCTGTLFSSMMFPDRAPKDSYLYTTFVGGSRNKELAKASTYKKLQTFHFVIPVSNFLVSHTRSLSYSGF